MLLVFGNPARDLEKDSVYIENTNPTVQPQHSHVVTCVNLRRRVKNHVKNHVNDQHQGVEEKREVKRVTR